MTMPSSVSRARYEGNGTATLFPFSFKVWETSQLCVTLTRPDGTSSVAEGWTASLDEDGGTVSYLHEGSPLPEGWLLAITRDMPFTQEIDLVSATRFDPAVMEDGLDMATAERQQLREQLSRSVILPPTSDKSPLELAERLLEAEKTAVDAARKAETEAVSATEQAGRAEAEAATAAAHATDAEEAARLARAWAESPTPPDPDDPGSRSAKEWAQIASDTVPLATDSLPGKACFPPPFTIDAQGTVGIRNADAAQNGLVRLSNAVNSATGKLAASDTAVKTAYDKAVAAATAASTATTTANNALTRANQAVASAGSVALKGSRSTIGNWTLSGLTVGKPLYILASNTNTTEDYSYVFLKVLSGAVAGTSASTVYARYFYIGCGMENSSTNTFITIPTAATVVIGLTNLQGAMTLRAYQ